jgi:hypothetical protein
MNKNVFLTMKNAKTINFLSIFVFKCFVYFFSVVMCMLIFALDKDVLFHWPPEATRGH